MAKEYIEREAAIEMFEQAFDNNWEVSGTLDRLRAIPTADVVEVNAKREMVWAAEAEELKEGKTMDMDLIDRAVRQMLNNQLIIMGALDDLIMHGGGNRWAKVHPVLIALHNGMTSTSAILAQSAEPPKEDT